MKAKTIVLSVCLVLMVGMVAGVGYAQNAAQGIVSPVVAGMPYAVHLGEEVSLDARIIKSEEPVQEVDDLLSAFDINAQFRTAYLRKRLICTSV